MKLIYVDDERSAIDNFRFTVAGLPGIEDIRFFENGEEALKYAQSNPVDVAFLDLEMQEVHGLDLAQKLQEYCTGIKIIFVTAYSQYALDAWKVNATDFVLKPYSVEEIQKALEKCRLRPLPSRKIYIQTIPSLSITVDGKPVHISRPKPRELFALLVEQADRGLTTGEGISYLWPERTNDASTQSLFRMTYKRLVIALDEAGIGYIIASSDHRRYIRTEEVDCDLYRILSGDQQAGSKYNGQYLQEYSWAEVRNGQLSRMLLINQ